MNATPTGKHQLLLNTIEADLRASGQYAASCATEDAVRIDQVRSAGRRVGRILGWKVRTVVSAPTVGGTVNVYVVVTKSTPLHEELMRVRGEKAMRKFYNGLDIGL